MSASLADLVERAGLRSLAVVGLAKNVGKTVTLNHLVRDLAGRGRTLGLTSAGRDGERLDAVTGLPKPGIPAPEGSWIATAEQCLRQSGARVDVVQETAFQTALGRVLIARVLEAGPVELAGPDTVRQLQETAEAMRGCGAELILVDGAFDRKAVAGPAVTEGTILATGAALGPSVKETMDRTATVIALFGLKPPRDPELARLARPVIEQRRLATVEEDRGVVHLELPTALTHGAQVVSALGPRTRALVFGGSLPPEVLSVLSSRGELCRQVELVVADATRVFVEPAVWRRFVAQGGHVRVLRPIRLLAVTANPYAPLGPSYGPEEFLARIARVASPLPVFDLVLGEAANLPRPPRRRPPAPGEG